MKYAAILFAIFMQVSPVAADITVFAAASLKGPLDEIAVNTGGVTVSYGGSGALARQVALGAPADVVILAHEDWINVLVAQGHAADPVQILSNELVLVSNARTPIPLTKDGLGEGRIAMGFTASVPAGIYGKAALEHLGLWEKVAPRVVELDNVRAALALVARGEAPIGIVYATDARIQPNVYIAATFPSESHPPIRYIAAITSGGAEAAAFIAHLQSPAAQAIFDAAGFLPVAP